jgi:hypothetical protein
LVHVFVTTRGDFGNMRHNLSRGLLELTVCSVWGISANMLDEDRVSR